MVKINKNSLLVVLLFGIIFLSGCLFEKNCKDLEGKQISGVTTASACGDKSFNVDIDYVTYADKKCKFDIVVAPETPEVIENIEKESLFRHCDFPNEGINYYRNLTSEIMLENCSGPWEPLEENTKFTDLPEECDGNYGDGCCKAACKLVQNNDVRQDDYARCEIKEPTTGNYETLDFGTTDDGKQFSAVQSRFACGNEGNLKCYCKE